MPRKKVPECHRRRCVTACDHCKRRKERCNGQQPCRRCIDRSVESTCRFSKGTIPPVGSADLPSVLPSNVADATLEAIDPTPILSDIRGPTQDGFGFPMVQNIEESGRRHSSAVPVPQLSRLVRDTRGNFTFIGDSANLSFLQNIRRLVQSSITGPCSFTNDPLKSLMVEVPSDSQQHLITVGSQEPRPTPSGAEATHLIRRYMIAALCVLDLFDESDLLAHWPLESNGAEENRMPRSIYYLVFAIGALTDPQGSEKEADVYFSHGRYLTTLHCTEEPSLVTVQCYAMISFYLLCAARRNAAFMNLGVAVRAAQALGLHRRDISKLFPQEEYRTRERTWKVIRVLDLFMSASMGRPPSTCETRDTTVLDNYSASADLCSIFEVVLNDVYSKRMVAGDVLERISGMHRRWTTRFHKGLLNDGIQPEDSVVNGLPNLGMYHIKEAYYWTIVLLTRPFFIESISEHISRVGLGACPGDALKIMSTPNRDLVHACVDSAIRTIELLCGLLEGEGIPTKLPFVVNSVFVSALVVGLAYFGDLDQVLPLGQSLKGAEEILRLFPTDAVARRNEAIIVYLHEACELYTEKRAKQRMNVHSQVVGGIFGNVDQPAQAEGDGLQTGTEHGFYNLDSSVTPAPSQSMDLVIGMDEILSNWAMAYSEDPGPMSPRTLWFDPVDEAMPLFNTVDATIMDT